MPRVLRQMFMMSTNIMFCCHLNCYLAILCEAKLQSELLSSNSLWSRKGWGRWVFEPFILARWDSVQNKTGNSGAKIQNLVHFCDLKRTEKTRREWKFEQSLGGKSWGDFWCWRNNICGVIPVASGMGSTGAQGRDKKDLLHGLHSSFAYAENTFPGTDEAWIQLSLTDHELQCRKSINSL